MTEALYNELPDTSPTFDTTPNLVGYITDNPTEDTWFVKKAFYRLCSIKIYKDKVRSSGFEVTFCPYPPENFPDYPNEIHQFGQDGFNSYTDSVTFERDLKTV